MRSLRDTSGSAILAALFVAILISAIAGLYLQSVVQEVENAHRTRLALETVNVAEAGAEDALYALTQGNWSGWQGGAHGFSREITLPGGSAGEIRKVRTYLELDNPDTPIIVSEGVIIHPSGIRVARQVRIDLNRSGTFANGLTSRNGVLMKGNKTSVDSYNSDLGPYDPANPNDGGSVASTSVAVDAVSIQNADIFGYVATGGGQPKVGSNGSVTGKDTEAGIKVDPKRVSMDFYADFPPVETPTLTNPFFSTWGSTMGVPSWPTEFHLSSLSIGSGAVMSVYGDVTLIVDGNIDINGELRVEPGASLTVYVEGDVDVGGTGMMNLTNKPSQLVLFGTAPEGGGQDIRLHGNGAMAGAIYAPFADVAMKGGGSTGVMFGAVVANTISLNGNYEFHYDEALKDYGTNGKLSLVSWRELTVAGSRYDDVLALKDTGI